MGFKPLQGASALVKEDGQPVIVEQEQLGVVFALQVHILSNGDIAIDNECVCGEETFVFFDKATGRARLTDAQKLLQAALTFVSEEILVNKFRMVMALNNQMLAKAMTQEIVTAGQIQAVRKTIVPH